MIQNNLDKLLIFLLVLSFSGCNVFKGTKQDSTAEKADTFKEKDDGSLKAYSKVITDKAETDEGLFKVHKIEDKYYFEIPDSLIGREMLMVSRIAKAADKLAYGGENLHNQVMRWDLLDKNILLRVVSYNNVANDSLPIYQSVQNSNFEPIVMSFPLQAMSEDSSAYVINVTELYNTDVPALNISSSIKERYKISSLDKSRSFITSVKSFPINIEARHIMTYKAAKPPSNATTGSISVEINNSLVLLPKEPMQPRIYDQRVGWFTTSQIDFGLDAQKATKQTYIRRWRLEPSDMEAFKRGELVKPKQQIVYYIDPATPMKWRPYLKQGVEDWQKAFEAAGFKEAIIAKDPPSPEEDPDWSPEDARYSVIRYFASQTQNAYGPNVQDPRSGEIIESDIGWYHNVMNLLRNWYFIQTAAANPLARALEFDDEVMGRLIRYVSAHEVGHTLGLPHNFGSSAAYPVDSLRSPTFTAEFGTTPSIMDYARFNYIAQPGDEVTNFYPIVGPYDVYAIRWGYRPIPEAGSPQEEKPILHEWILEHEGDPIYRFGRQTTTPIDPRSTRESLGDNAMAASAYGLANLKIIVDNLLEWTAVEGEDYDDLNEMYMQVVAQWDRYMGHVLANIGGIYETYKAVGQEEGPVYEPVPAELQIEALQFLHENSFATPKWLMSQEILSKFEAAGVIERTRKHQEDLLEELLNPSRLARLIESEAVVGEEAFGIVEMFDRLQNGLFAEVNRRRGIEVFRRNLQRAYVDRMQFLMEKEQTEIPADYRDYMGYTSIDVSQSDIRPVVRGKLQELQRTLRTASTGYRSDIERYHLQDLVERIEKILNPNG